MRRLLTGFILINVLVAGPLLAAETTPTALTPAAAAAPAPVAEKVAAVEPVFAAKRFRVGYADILKVAEQSAAGKEAKAKFEAKAERLKKEITSKQKQLEKQKSTLEAKLPGYTPEQRETKIKAYEKKVDELRNLLQKADKEMKPMQEELLKEIYGKIEKAAREYGAAKGFDAIVEKRELLYLGNNVEAEEITEALVTALDKKL